MPDAATITKHMHTNCKILYSLFYKRLNFFLFFFFFFSTKICPRIFYLTVSEVQKWYVCVEGKELEIIRVR